MHALKQLSRVLREKQRGTDGGDASSELCNEKRHDKIRIGAERKSICAAMVDAAETRKVAFTIFPRSSIFSIIVIAGTGLTMPIRRPAALLSSCRFSSNKESGFEHPL